jgi:acyl-coenzyme A thioesterase PaaI-like protein
MNAMRLAQTLASNPFFQFAKLGTVNKNSEEHLRLGFDSFLKNHIGTLHAGALFTVAQADAHSNLVHALEQYNPGWKVATYTSQIFYKRPAKGPVWVNTTAPTLDWEKRVAHTVSTLNSETDEPVAELHIEFRLIQGEL